MIVIKEATRGCLVAPSALTIVYKVEVNHNQGTRICYGSERILLRSSFCYNTTCMQVKEKIFATYRYTKDIKRNRKNRYRTIKNKCKSNKSY